ncbi:MAG: hypothetical protein JJU13_03680, partial [Balneolaceae bacterium]|nr:hypothetical protein [Balneolaceae bacterium]
MNLKILYKIGISLFAFSHLLFSSIQAQDDPMETWEYVAPSSDFTFEVERFESNPIIHREMAGMIGPVGENINGPSLIKV